jgi:hypothetical protein
VRPYLQHTQRKKGWRPGLSNRVPSSQAQSPGKKIYASKKKIQQKLKKTLNYIIINI